MLTGTVSAVMTSRFLSCRAKWDRHYHGLLLGTRKGAGNARVTCGRWPEKREGKGITKLYKPKEGFMEILEMPVPTMKRKQQNDKSV